MNTVRATSLGVFLISAALVLLELLVTRVFGVVLFASFAHLALGLAMLGISAGAVMQHLWPQLVPAEDSGRRLGSLALLQGAASLLAVIAAVALPLTRQSATPPLDYGERSSIAWDLVDPLWFSLLLPVLALPFVLAGLGFAGVFQRYKEHIGRIYAADLAGGAIGALAFLPVLALWPASDAVFVVVLACAGATAALWRGLPRARLAYGVGLLSLGALIASGAGVELLRVRYSAGYSEQNVTWSTWTPLARIAIHEDRRGVYALLDNSSASEVVLTPQARSRKALEVNRGLVYRLHPPGARIAILAASAGPEVAVAQAYGHHDIEAIDIAPVGDIVAARWPESPVNPYATGGTQIVHADGRSAILHSQAPYDIIQMVHANLHSSAGLLASAWSPSLIETREAFGTYLDRLTDDGTLSFARGSKTRVLARSAAEALRERGVREPERHIFYIAGDAALMLVKKRPWTEDEAAQVRSLVSGYRNEQVSFDPLTSDAADLRRLIGDSALMTDDRPYLETPQEALDGLEDAALRLLHGGSGEVEAVAIIYNTLAIQALFVLLSGVLLVGLPALLRRRELRGTGGVAAGLLYVAGLGYGYLAVETALIHDLVLFVGHPTYALTTVILAMLLCSGAGSAWAEGVRPERLLPTLRGMLLAVLALGALQALVVAPALSAAALGLPMGARVLLTALALAPLGFVMGTPFPLAMRILRPEAAAIVPWAWAVNGWMSVVASLGTVLISRLYGYTLAYGVALAAYALALALTGRLSRVGLSARS